MPQESIDAMFSRRRHGDTPAIRTAALQDILAVFYAPETPEQARFVISATLRATDGLCLADDQSEARVF